MEQGLFYLNIRNNPRGKKELRNACKQPSSPWSYKTYPSSLSPKEIL